VHALMLATRHFRCKKTEQKAAMTWLRCSPSLTHSLTHSPMTTMDILRVLLGMAGS
jgi:hypothetical protein